MVVSHPGRGPYAYWDATGEVELVHWALRQAVEVEVPVEISDLKRFDRARKEVDSEFDLPSKDVSLLVRWIMDQGGRLSAHRRKQVKHLPKEVLDRIEEIVRAAAGE